MSGVRWQPILDGFSYKPGTFFDVIDDRVLGPTFRVHVETVDSRRPGHAPLRIVHPTAIPDWVLDDDTAKAFVRFCVREVELHEVDEWLRFGGALLHDPHAGEVRPPVRRAGPTPADMPPRRGGMPPCNTPEKARYRSAAQARRHHRDSYWIGRETHASEKPKMRPYLCPSGEHWHLTSQLPNQDGRCIGPDDHSAAPQTPDSADDEQESC